MITRKHCPGPWHDAIANHYQELMPIAPQTGAEYLARTHGIAPDDVKAIHSWARATKRRQPCPVAA